MKKKVNGTSNNGRRYVKSKKELHNFAIYPNSVTDIKKETKKLYIKIAFKSRIYIGSLLN